MHKTSLQISILETSMVWGRSFDAYVNVFIVLYIYTFTLIYNEVRKSRRLEYA